MANRVFQNVVYQMKDAIDRVVGVVDETGAVIACSELGQIGEMREGFAVARLTAGDAFEKDGYAYHQFSNAKHNDYAVFVEGNDPTAAQFASLLSISLQSIKQYHDEKFDKTNFIKNVVLDNILPSDIYIKSKELHFNAEECRVVFLIKFFGKTDMMPYEMVQNMFPDRTRDYVISVSEHDVVLVKEVKQGTETAEMEKVAVNIADTLSSEFYTKASIGVSTVVENIKDLGRAYKEAQIALLEGDAAEVLKTLEGSYDFIFMDAAKGQYIHFLPEILRLLAKDGVLVSDNVLQDGDVIESRFAVTRRNRTIHKRMREYLYTLTHSEELVTAVLPVGDGITLSTRR